MTIDDVAAEVERIRQMAGDDEAAHSAEDRLHRNVLFACAEGNPDAPNMALAALRTLEINFQRWCA